MWTWIKYLPLEWRKRKVNCTPKGPQLGRLTPQTCIPIAGSQLCFRAPAHQPRRKGLEQQRLLPGSDALRQGIGRHYGLGVMANDHWGGVTPFFRAWTFWGPWMTGAKAELLMGVEVIGRYEEYAFADASFFHPKTFEIAVLRYLNDYYGHRQWDDGKPRHYGPVDWKLGSQLPVFSANCKVYNLEPDGYTRFAPKFLFLFPVTPKHFVKVVFQQDVYSFDDEMNPAFDITPVQTLQDAILDSMTLELSPEAQAEWDRVKAECGDMSLTEHFPPLRWPTSGGEEAEPELSRLQEGG